MKISATSSPSSSAIKTPQDVEDAGVNSEGSRTSTSGSTQRQNTTEFTNKSGDMNRLLQREFDISSSNANQDSGDNASLDLDLVGDNIGLFGQQGEDHAIKLTGNNNNVITQDGYDVVELNGTNSTASTGSRSDTVAVSGDSHTVNLGDGSDIFVGSGSNHVISGEGGEDSFFLAGDDNRISGGDGADKIDVVSGSNNEINGDAGEDQITLKFSGSSDVSGGQGDDTISLAYGLLNTIDGDAGNDIITTDVSRFTKINGGAGDDQIFINGGTQDPGTNEAFGGEGDDEFTAANYHANVVHGEAGYDTLNTQLFLTDDLVIAPVPSSPIDSTRKPAAGSSNDTLFEIRYGDGAVAIQFSGMERVNFVGGAFAEPDGQGGWVFTQGDIVIDTGGG